MDDKMDEVKVVIEEPDSGDVEAMAALFKEDMDALGVETKVADQLEVARAAVDGMAGDQKSCLCWVARVGQGEEEESFVGGVLLANFNWSLKFAGRALWIEALYVTPRARRRGIGVMLIDRVLDWSEDNGVRGIDLEAYRGNTPASILYRSFGFRRLGRERFYYRVEGSGYL